jgi:serine/threonine protein phosphatase PrpC
MNDEQTQTAIQHYDVFRNVMEWLNQPSIQIIAAATIILGVALLLYINYSLHKKVQAMSDTYKNPNSGKQSTKNQTYDGMKNGRPFVKSVEIPKQANPDLDGFATSTPFKEDEIGTEKDLQSPSAVEQQPAAQTRAEQPLTPPVTLDNTPSEQPKIILEKLEPGIHIRYKTVKSGVKSVRENVVEELIKERLDTKVFPNGQVGTAYEEEVDIASKDIVDVIGGIDIEEVKVLPTLAKLGLRCEKVSSTKFKITGTPTADYNGKLYFLLGHPTYPKQRETVTPKTEITSFTELLPGQVHAKPFIINAHPKSLWLDLPVENDEGYQNLDNESNGETVEYVPTVKRYFSTMPAKSFEVIAASARGRSHAHIGKPRDDAFYYEFDKETGWNFVAVADGAGSAKYSRKGSELATRTVVKKLRETLTKEFNQRCFYDKRMSFQRWKVEFIKNNGKLSTEQENEFVVNTQFDKVFHLAVDAAYRAIHDEHKRRDGSVLKDYHTTLLCAAFRWFPELDNRQGGWFIASYWVGDGGAAILRPMFDGISIDKPASDLESKFPKDRVFVLGEPDGGEFAGQTRFLTMPEEMTAEKIRSRCRFSFCDSFESIILVSDGITDPFFPSEAAVVDEPRWLEFYEKKLKDGCEEEPNGCKEVFADNIAPNVKAEALLKWLGFWSKGNHDDRTILIVRPQ